MLSRTEQQHLHRSVICPQAEACSEEAGGTQSTRVRAAHFQVLRAERGDGGESFLHRGLPASRGRMTRQVTLPRQHFELLGLSIDLGSLTSD
jgi:hypothetical protein